MGDKFIIQPHFRLQEWVAEEKGYFRDEGLEYTFHEEVQKTAGQVHDKGARVGAYQSLESGRASDVSCACHWTVNVAAAASLPSSSSSMRLNNMPSLKDSLI